MPYKTGSWGEQAKKRSRSRSLGENNPGYWKEYTTKLKKLIYEILGDKCVKCGFDDKRALQMDHINNDGYKERWAGTNDANRYLKVLKDPSRFQILCANCNWIKRYEKEDK